MGSIGPTELIIVGIIIVLLFGATRLPATAKGLGQALKLFKKEVTSDDDKPEVTSAQAAAQPAPAQTQYQQAPVAQPQYQQAPPAPQAAAPAAPAAPAPQPSQATPAQKPTEPQSVTTPGNQG